MVNPKWIDRFFRSHLVLVGYTASGISTFIYIIHNTLLKSRSILCFFCSTKNSYQLLEKSHLLLYKAKIETIHPKSLIITFAMKPLYLKHIYKLLKSFFFLSTRFLDYRSHALYIFYQFHVLDFAKFRLQYVRYPSPRMLREFSHFCVIT